MVLSSILAVVSCGLSKMIDLLYLIDIWFDLLFNKIIKKYN